MGCSSSNSITASPAKSDVIEHRSQAIASVWVAAQAVSNEQACGTLSANVMRGEYLWTIEDFAYFDCASGERLVSNTFQLIGHAWRLSLYPNGKYSDWQGHLSIYLALRGKADVSARYRFSIIDQDGQSQHEAGPSSPQMFTAAVDAEHRDTSANRGIGLWVNRSRIFKSSAKLLCKGALCVRLVVERVEPVEKRAKKASQSTHLLLVENLRTLLDSGCHSDVKFVIQGTEMAAHRSILSARSPVFKAMLQQPFSESSTGIIVLDDIKPAVWRQLLRFLYTSECDFTDQQQASGPEEKDTEGKWFSESDAKCKGVKESVMEPESKSPKSLQSLQTSEKDNQFVMDLLAAADRFQLPSLLSLCADKLAPGITIYNAAECLLLADKHHCEELQERVVEYLRADTKRVTQVMAHEAFHKLDVKVVHELLRSLSPSTRA